MGQCNADRTRAKSDYKERGLDSVAERKCCSNCNRIKTIRTLMGDIAAHKCSLTDWFIMDYTRCCIHWQEREEK